MNTQVKNCPVWMLEEQNENQKQLNWPSVCAKQQFAPGVQQTVQH